MDIGYLRIRRAMGLVLGLLLAPATNASEPIQFSRDVLPILSDRCFHCHGPDAEHREAELRLDLHESALADRGGYAAIVPGKPDTSELFKRITSADGDTLMPPPSSHRKRLSDAEIATLKQWIAEGAIWGKHWAFEKPVKPAVPAGSNHPIDAFVRRKLADHGLQLAPSAPQHTLIRRVSFDLTGLPPSPEEIERFVGNDTSDAYGQLVERLLQSPHFGERMAMWWLDAARYADTDGFQQDASRTNWPWRDWVVQSFNENKPFDRFTIEQFAGDLLPDATADQILATCFHRNHMTNGEGGRDPEESRIDYVIDRVNTTGTVWLGLTLGCCQCHAHKFDPISHEDYYSLFAFFNSIDEDGKAGTGAKPYLKYKSPHAERAIKEAQQVAEVAKTAEAQAMAQAREDFEPWLVGQLQRVPNGFESWTVLRPAQLESVEGTVLTDEGDGTIQASGPNPRQDDYRLTAAVSLPRVTALRLEVFPHESHTEGKLSRGASGEFILTDVKIQVRRRSSTQLRDIDIATAVADVEKDAKARNYGKIVDTLDDDPRNGWTTESHDPRQRHVANFVLAEPLVLGSDEELVFVLLQRSTEGDANIGRFRVSASDQRGRGLTEFGPMPLEQLAQAKITEIASTDGELRERLFDQFLADHEVYQTSKEQLDRATRQLAEVKKAAGEVSVMVLSELAQPRNTHVLERGVWDKHGAEVPTLVPEAVLAWPAERTKSRLDLAQWLVSPDNPLTPRVVVNHLWQLCFGAGLVRTPEDFGLQGERPTHPELLDWLAVEFLEHHWDLRHVLRLIVTSETYRQNSDVSAELLTLDPENRLLARGSRYRLPSWMIRDGALKAAGLLNPAVGGPPVMPYQPPGVWEANFMGRFRYEPSLGPAQYRRTLYAFWRRSSAPTFLFDNAQRRVCEVRPQITNTPLQALTLLNDLSILESSHALAINILERETSTEERLTDTFAAILGRRPSESEQKVLKRELDRSLTYYRQFPGDANQLLKSGQLGDTEKMDPAELAGYMVVASLVFNLDEAMTHE